MTSPQAHAPPYPDRKPRDDEMDIFGVTHPGKTRSENQDQAAGFLAYLTNPTNAELLAQFFPPPRESLLNVETLSQAAPKLSPEEIQSAIIDVVPDASVKPQHPVLSQFSDKVRAGLDPVWSGGDVEAAVTGICEQISPTLKG